jgi:type I restriction enzyme S subunit
LKHVCRVNAATLPEDTPEDLEIEYVDISAVDELGRISKPDTTTFGKAPSRARRVIRSGDVLISTVRTYLKAIAHVPLAEDNLICSTGFAVLTASPRVVPRFLFYWISSDAFVGQVVARSVGVSYPAINPGELMSLPFPPWPTNTQAAIAMFLDHELAGIDDLIWKKQRLIELLDEKRAALISRAVTQGLDPGVPMKDSGVELIGRIPQHWGVMAFKRTCTRNIVGIAEAATHAYADQGVPLIRSTNLSERGLLLNDVLHIDRSLAEENRTRYLRAGDILTVRTGNAGISSVVPKELAGSQCFTLLVSTLKAGHSSEYYVAFLNSSPAKRFFSLESWGTAQMNISVPIIQNVPCPVPPPDEQAKIAEAINKTNGGLDEQLRQCERGINLLREYRSALITAAVTGQLDIRAHEKQMETLV